MKKIFNYLILALSAAAVLSSCSVNEPAAGPGRQISFTTSFGSFKVKATDTAFEKGDAIGLSVSEPVSVSNAKLVCEGGSIKSVSPIYWGDEQGSDEKSVFYAYYPYAENADLEKGFEFTVNADQSTHELYTASDFMTAVAFASPGSGPVHLDFVHRFSKVVISIDNKLDEEIKDVYLADVYGRAIVSADVYDTELSGEPGTIKSGKVTKADGSTAWALIIVPQYSSPRLLVTTVSDKQYSYDLDTYVSFVPGHQYNASVEINEQTIVGDLTSDIIDWTDDTDLQFGQHGNQGGSFSTLSITGDIMNLGWSQDIVMDYVSSVNMYYGVIYYEEGQSFKLRGDFDWTVNFGFGNVGTGHWFEAVRDGDNIAITDGSGIYEVIFDPSDNTIAITPYGQFYTWSLIGSFNNWDGDVATSLGLSGGVYPVVSAVVTLDDYSMFKFRANNSWDYDYGISYDYSGVEIKENVWYPAQQAGADVQIGQGGTFRVVFDLSRKLIAISREGGNSGGLDSIPDVIEGPDDQTYTVRGVVSKIVNASYGNYYISDEHGFSLYIYGTKDEAGNYPKDIDGGLASLGIVIGNTVTVTGPKTTYIGTPELVDVSVVNVEQGPINLYSDTATLDAAGGEIRIPFYVVDDAEAGVSLQGDIAGWASYYIEPVGNNNYNLVLVYSANESGSTASGFLVFSSGGLSLSVSLTQSPYISGSKGTASNPFTVSEIAGLVLGGTTFNEDVYIKGVVSAVLYTASAGFPTATFWISDDGKAHGVSADNRTTTEPTRDFECYSVRWFGNSDWVEGNGQISVGDEVVVCGATTIYNGVAETSGKKAWLYSVNGVTTAGLGLGSVEYPFNIAGAVECIDNQQAAIAAAKEMGVDAPSFGDVYVKGKISAILYTYSASYSTASFWISDDGTAYGVSADNKTTTEPGKDFECYSVYMFGLDNTWVEGSSPQPAVGDEVVVCGQLTKYGSTYETSSRKAYVYSLNGATR